MTGYTVHTGSNDKFSSGWDHIFAAGTGKKAKKNEAAGEKKAGKSAKASSEKKSASKKVKRGK